MTLREITALIMLLTLTGVAGRAAADPVVVELFTSQGCNSCPPADALLGELAARPDVLPLAFHVTYWDRLGWTDTFGLEASVDRQTRHAKRLGLRGLYTPQMVVGGRLDVVGSQRDRVLAALDLFARHNLPEVALQIEPGRVVIGTGDGGPAAVWLAAYDLQHEVQIERGENRGRTLPYYNVVRSIRKLGDWSGSQTTLTWSPDLFARHDALAIWLEREDDGHILAAVTRPIDD